MDAKSELDACDISLQAHPRLIQLLPVSGAVDLSFSVEAVASVSRRQENRFTAVKEGQQLKGEVLLVHDDFVLLLLRGHAKGKLAYMPARRVSWDQELPSFPRTTSGCHKLYRYLKAGYGQK